MPPALRRLLAQLIRLLAGHTNALEAGAATVEQWRDRMAATLSRYTQAAYLAGSGDKALNQITRGIVLRAVQEQVKYLDNFAVEIQSAAEWRKGFNARAVLYAGSIKAPYWQGRTQLLPLPFMPGQGTQCMGNCGCSWEVVTLDADAGDYDCFWRRGKNDSCATCVEREGMNPYEIRGGVLQ